jgi:hypothetical protein
MLCCIADLLCVVATRCCCCASRTGRDLLMNDTDD